MDIEQLHSFLGKLLDAGVDRKLPVVSIVDGWPNEIRDCEKLIGPYHGDPSPKMSAFAIRGGAMLALIPQCEDVAELLNPREESREVTHVREPLPVEY